MTRFWFLAFDVAHAVGLPRSWRSWMLRRAAR